MNTGHRFRDLWNRDNDGDRREQRSFVRYAIVATALALLFLLVKRDNIITWTGAGFTLAGQNHRIERLRKENADLDARIHDLSFEKDSLETFARQELNFAAPGEDVYIIR